jgi:DNA invertase Pin-like site-specific DNA recombinase
MNTTTVALYCRISRDTAGRVEGVDRQERWGRDYARRTWPGADVQVHADNDLSGDPTVHRPGLEAMRAAVRAGQVAHVWAVEQSRLTRDEIQWFELAAELLDAGIEVLHTDRDGIVRLDEVGGIRAVLNAAERRKLRQRVNGTLADLAAQGRPGGGHHVAYRHTTDPEGRAALEPIPEVADAVRWAAEHVLTGWTLTAVAAEMERRGVPTAHGGRWTHGNVKGMLTSPIVAGLRVHQGQVVRPGTWDPVLDQDTWRVLCWLLDGRKREPHRTYLLSGLARCGLCDTGLTGRRRHARGQAVPYYFCAPTVGGCSRLGIMASPLEENVRDRTLAELDRREAFGAALAEDQGQALRGDLTRQLAAVEQRHVDLARRWAAGDLPAAAWDAARTDLELERARLTGELAVVPAPVGRIDATELREGWDHMTVEERRHVLRALVARVHVEPAVPGRRFDPDRIGIAWREV